MNKLTESQKILGKVAQGRQNNLDLLRFIAALMVIFCHAFPVSQGSGHTDFLGELTQGRIHMGSLAVCVFFLFGGFLISKSMDRIKVGGPFFKARALKIFPCLCVVVLISVFLLGPILTTLPLIDYLTNAQTYKYLINTLLIPVHNLPGVFENNIYGSAINGSLWTLPVEFVCYIICFLAYKLHLSEKKYMKWTIPVITIGYIFVCIIFKEYSIVLAACRPMMMFYIGMICYTYRDHIILDFKIMIGAVVLLIISLPFKIFSVALFVFLPYILFYLGFGTQKKYSNFSKYGEISYGMYLCGWPVQQVIVLLFGGKMNPFINFLLTAPIVIICGLLLRKFVEDYFEKKKNRY